MDRRSGSLVLFLVLLCGIKTVASEIKEPEDENFGSEEDCTTPRNLPGKCINIKSCPVLLGMLQNRTEPGWKEYLVKSQCGTKDNNVIKVCCPSSSNNNPDESASARDELPDTSVCGRLSVRSQRLKRVVNGRPAELGAWPWMAALGYKRSPSKPLLWSCGGSLISNRHVLTTAVCVQPNIKLTVVRLGELNLDGNVQDGAAPIDVPVEKTIVHENYDVEANINDIALVILQYRVEFSKLIHPICVPSQNLFPKGMSGHSALLLGWGRLGFTEQLSSALQEAHLNIVDQDFCSNAFRNFSSRITLDERVICALGDDGEDSCQGDSGGPLMLSEKGNFYVIGLVSYGIKCGDRQFPGVYTNVSMYGDWIKKAISS